MFKRKKVKKRHPIDDISELERRKKVKSVIPRSESKVRVEIYEVIRILPSKKHAMVDSNVGLIKKELNNIPTKLIKRFNEKKEIL